jgi:sodium transport system permease protein
MSPIWVIARKEFMDVLRDRRTLVFMLLLPIVVMPLVMIAFTRVTKSQLRAKESRRLTVAIDKQGQQRLIALGKQWSNDNLLHLLALGGRLMLSVGEIDINDLEHIVDRVNTYKEAGESTHYSDAAIAAGYVAYQQFTDREKQLLEDAAAVHAVLSRTDWRDLEKVARQGEARLPPGVQLPKDLPPGLDSPAVTAAIVGEAKELHAALHVPTNVFERLEERAVSVPITILYDSSQSLSREAYGRFSAFFGALEHTQIDVNLKNAELSPGFVQPFSLKSANVASESRKAQAIIGSILPYLIILFCFFGAFYPSLDLTAGEKERFTLETLLLAPVSRLEIAAGNFMVVFAAAITAAVLSTTSMALTLTHGVLPEDTARALHLEFQPLALVLTASLLLPVAALFSSLLLGIALLARSFKEAQSYATPLQLLVIIPAVAALLPDLETDLALAWVPLMNVSLLMKELLKGNYLWDFYLITLSTTVVLTCVVLWLTGLLFRRESVLLRS